MLRPIAIALLIGILMLTSADAGEKTTKRQPVVIMRQADADDNVILERRTRQYRLWDRRINRGVFAFEHGGTYEQPFPWRRGASGGRFDFRR